MYILGIHTGHDAAACLFKGQELIAFCKEERVTRIKCDGDKFDLLSIDEVLRIANITRGDLDAVCLSRIKLPEDCYLRSLGTIKELSQKVRGVKKKRWVVKEMAAHKELNEDKLIDYGLLRQKMGLKDEAQIIFTNHHYAHILGAFKYSDWQDSALYISCDGGGDGAQYSAYFYDGTELKTLVGGDVTVFEAPQNLGASVGYAYSQVTKMCGFTPLRHEGKITGLAAFGKPVASQKLVDQFKVNQDGSLKSQLDGSKGMREFLDEHFAPLSREDKAASIQVATEEIILKWVTKLVSISGAKFVGLSGGVFSNVKLNQCVSEIDGIEEIFVFPAMGDEGLPVGQCVDFLIRKEGTVNLVRNRLDNAYCGFDYNADSLVQAAEAKGFKIERNSNVADLASSLIKDGKVGAIYHGAMEMGPRALGARSIIASPEQRNINDSLNERLDRTEFMPFAPYVLAEDISEVFEVDSRTLEACKFMTVTANVREKYRDVIPAVVHVDGTARPQVVYREKTALYYDILKGFKEKTGMPCLVNTSFNAHEEPIINTPEEALQALSDDRMDFLVCEQALIFKN